MKNVMLASSIICANLLDLRDELAALDKANIDWIHFDVMDGVFVPRYGLHPEMLSLIKSVTKIPVDVHLMVTNPDPYIAEFTDAGADLITVHYETCPNLHQTIRLIKERGVKAGVVINPATTVESLKYILPDIDCVVIMAINPGIVGHKLIPTMIGKIADLKRMVKDRPNFIIEIDGGVSFESGPLMRDAGANLLVCGTSSIYREASVPVRVKEFRKILKSKKS